MKLGIWIVVGILVVTSVLPVSTAFGQPSPTLADRGTQCQTTKDRDGIHDYNDPLSAVWEDVGFIGVWKLPNAWDTVNDVTHYVGYYSGGGCPTPDPEVTLKCASALPERLAEDPVSAPYWFTDCLMQV